MDVRSPIRVRTLVAVFGLVVLVVGINQVNPIGAVDPGEPVIACHGAEGDATTYGGWIKCAAGGGGGTALVWPDGKHSGLQATRTPMFVGEGTIDLVDDERFVLASFPLRIEPDIRLECSDRDADVKKIFELVETDTNTKGWDYVYADVDTGERVLPGDPAHPNGGVGDGLERVQLGTAVSTGLCRIHSAAADDFDGEYQLTVESPWEASQSTPMRIIGPSSKTQWAGTQPAEVVGTVTVNDLTVSERSGVYQSGCT